MTVPLRFDGRTAVVTGAGAGLGRATALLLAERGASVVVNGPDDEIARVVEEISALGGRARASADDVAEEAGAVAAIEAALGDFGTLDIVVNAASGPRADADPMPEVVRAAWQVLVGGAFNLTKAAWPHLQEGGTGRVVNVCSESGLLVPEEDGDLAHDIASGGLVGFTRVLANEGNQVGILVNGLVPVAEPARGADDIAWAATTSVWLAHVDCGVHGRFLTAGAGQVGEVYTSAGAGYQCPVTETFSIEDVRAHWDQVTSTEGSITPTTNDEYNAFRLEIYRATVQR